MDLPTMSIFGALFAFAIFFYWKISRASSSKITAAPPEPAGAWPLLGHLPMLMGSQLPHITLGNLADEYGPAFAIRHGLRKVLVVSSSELAKECFSTNDKVFATRPSSVAAKIMGYNYAFFGLSPSGLYWREMRKIAIFELLSKQRLESLKHVWISEIDTYVREIYQVCAAEKSSRKQSALVEIRHRFSEMSLNVTVRMIAGTRYSGEDAKHFQKVTREFFLWIGAFMVGDAFPFLGWADFRNEREMRRSAKEVDNVLSKWLEEHRQSRLDGGNEQDFMDVLLTILDDKDLYGYKADTVNKATCLNMIFGGSDTTAITLTWALSLLLNNRQALKKAQDEIHNLVGNDKRVDESDAEKLIYLHAIVKETMRLYPVVPLSGPREAMEDCTVAGYHIPAGMRLIVNMHKIQRDPEIWSSPDEFQPERFLTTKANIDVKGQHFELLPFGSGRRICPGISLGLRLVHLALARLLQGFDFETPSNEAVDMSDSPGLSNFKAGPLEVIVTPRLSSNLY